MGNVIIPSWFSGHKLVTMGHLTLGNFLVVGKHLITFWGTETSYILLVEPLEHSSREEQGLVLAALKNELRKIKGKAVDKEAIETHSVDPNVSKDNMEPITPKLLNKRTAHSSYIKHTQEEALVLRDIVEHVKANYPHDLLLEYAFRYTKVIQDLLSDCSFTYL
ncbi:hypothetical protein Tco_1273552 [Tanacetum coccineum]